MKRLFIYNILILISYFGVAQEICNNCIDDDNDGFIDCYDSECFNNSVCNNFFIKDSLSKLLHPCVNIDSFQNDFTFNIKEKWRVTNYKYQYPAPDKNITLTTYTHPVGDIDNDGEQEIITTFKDSNGVYQLAFHRGINGEVKFAKPIVAESLVGNFTIGDVDNDGYGEIIGMMQQTISDNYGLVCFEHTGEIKWYNQTDFIFSNTDNISWDGINAGLVDFDGNGIAEVYCRNKIFNALTGELISSNSLSSGAPPIHPLGNNPNRIMHFPIAADLLPDSYCPNCNGLELACGNMVYIYDTSSLYLATGSRVNNSNLLDGFTAVADFDGDSQLDIIVNHGMEVYVWNPRTGDQIGSSYLLPGTRTDQMGSVPTVADFDNDGQLEIVISDQENIYMIDNDMTLAWKYKAVDNSSVASTSSIAFDFNCDGILDVVHMSDSLWILNGSTGQLIKSLNYHSGTLYERPTIADIDLDGHADLIITHEIKHPIYSGIRDRLIVALTGNNWAPTRSVMNQFNYNITNINDDLTIPCIPQNNLKIPYDFFNSYLVSVPLMDKEGNSVCYIDSNYIGNPYIPIVSNVEDTSFCIGEEFYLKRSSEYPWIIINDNDDTILADSFLLIQENSSFYFLLSYDDSCNGGAISIIRDTMEVEVNNCGKPFIPNGFTPDGDGINDNWRFTYSAIPEKFIVRVYNRFGELVYSSNDYEFEWAGNLRSLGGVYVYHATIDDIDYQGSVAVLK